MVWLARALRPRAGDRRRPEELTMSPMRVRLGDLAELLKAELIGDANLEVTRIGTLDAADEFTISFLANPRYQAQLSSTRAACVIVSPALLELAVARGAAMVSEDPYLAFARLTQFWRSRQQRPSTPGIHPQALVEEGARIHASASVGAMAYVGRGAQVGAAAVIGVQSYIGEEAEVGEGSWLKARVVLSEACRMGSRGIVHSGAVIGADGFGFAPDQGRWEKIEQLGAVVIGDDVEIGANTCIDRGALEDTVLEDGVKLDNLVQIGHNVRIGAHTAFAGCVGVAGSARIGRHCTAGGGAIILGHLEIVDHVHITAATLITRSIRKPGQYSGAFPFDDNASWEKNAATLRQLHALRDRLRALERKIT